MSPMPAAPSSSQPSAAAVQELLRAYAGGRAAEALRLARLLLQRHPNAVVAHSVLASTLAQQGETAAALPHFEAAARLQPAVAELQHNLALALTTLGRLADAVPVYRRSVALKPDVAVAHFNLAAALQGLGQLEAAARHGSEAVRLQPAYAEAWGQLGTVRQAQGRLDDAVAAYERALALPLTTGPTRARLLLSLASALRNLGQLPRAIALLREAVAVAPDLAEAHDRLGWALWAQGDGAAAQACYERALGLQPDLADAHYHLGVLLQDSGARRAAIPHFTAAQIGDSADRALYCLYREGDFAAFRAGLDHRLLQPEAHRSPLLATLAAHHAHNFAAPNPHRFCPRPLDFIVHRPLAALTPGSRLLGELLADIEGSELALRGQGRLHHGVQSSGNLFRRPEASFRQLANLVLDAVCDYPRAFPGADCLLIADFPEHPAYSSSWYIRMRQGGHLTSHIHEEGWISGCVYLAMPAAPPGRLDGSIAFSTHGDDHPRLQEDFPERTITPVVGDLVLFPSSLFHRTIPYAADEARICVAFDILPAGNGTGAGAGTATATATATGQHG